MPGTRAFEGLSRDRVGGRAAFMTSARTATAGANALRCLGDGYRHAVQQGEPMGDARDGIRHRRAHVPDGAGRTSDVRALSTIADQHPHRLVPRPPPSATFSGFDDRELHDQTRRDCYGGPRQPVVAVRQQHSDRVADRRREVPESLYVVGHRARSVRRSLRRRCGDPSTPLVRSFPRDEGWRSRVGRRRPDIAAEFLDAVLSPGMTLGDAVAVRSTDGDGDYITAANVGGEPAVWFAGVDGDAGVVWSVNEHAVDVSQAGKAQDAGGSISDDDVEAALSCLS
jgi:hypothetical protein